MALPVALWAPRSAVVLAGTAVGGYFAAGLVDGPIFLAVPLTAFVAARRANARALIPWLTLAAGAVVAGLTLRSVLHEEPGRMALWQGTGVVAVTGAAAVLGWWLAGRGEVRAERARRAAAEERLRMAQDLHDGVGHGLAVIAMQAGVALHLLDRQAGGESETDTGSGGSSGQVRRSLEVIRAASTEALDELRAGLARLAPERAGTTGAEVSPADRRPQRGLADLGRLLERVRSGGTQVELVARPLSLVTSPGSRGAADPGPDQAVQVAAYTIVQESLTNVLRHAGAVRARVELDLGDGVLIVVVRDDGAGAAGAVPREPGEDGAVPADPEAGDGAGHGHSRGISGMRSRAARLGGSLEAGPVGGGGWQVRAVLPVPAEQEPGRMGRGGSGKPEPTGEDPEPGTERRHG
jgi:signal transduction histidine kinase